MLANDILGRFPCKHMSLYVCVLFIFRFDHTGSVLECDTQYIVTCLFMMSVASMKYNSLQSSAGPKLDGPSLVNPLTSILSEP